MRIGVFDVFVNDQARARDFYTGVLGLEVKTDAAHGDSGRWLTMVSPEELDGVELPLAPLDEAAEALQAARRERGAPAVSFTTDDYQRSYAQLRDRGVVFVSEPQAFGYGGIDAVSEDGCGNLLNLHHQTPAASGA
jgi:catechol 2,3-dioxygenase-like lactoylglutathione lyase family enzyme